MRKILATLLFFGAFQLNAQTYPITGINISLPPNPDSMIANWKAGSSMLTISANAKVIAGRPDARIEDSKILAVIRKTGSKACGKFTSTSAPSAKFTSSSKIWNGNEAVALFGEDCTLPPGDYELCVRIFGHASRGAEPMSEDKCKSFKISATEQPNYQPPQPLSPVNGQIFSEGDLKKSMTFKWTPVIPRPTDPLTYRLKVWQLLQGQTSTEAMKRNQPIGTKDVSDFTQAVIDNLIGGPCKPAYPCEFIWNVQALNREGKPIGTNNGMNEVFAFKIKIVEIKGDQSPESRPERRDTDKR